MLSLDVSAKARHQTPKATSKGTEAKRGWNRALCQFCVSLSLCFPCVPEGEVEMDLQLHAYRKEMTFPPPSASHLSLSHTYSKQTLSQAERTGDRQGKTFRIHSLSLSRQGQGGLPMPCRPWQPLGLAPASDRGHHCSPDPFLLGPGAAILSESARC